MNAVHRFKGCGGNSALLECSHLLFMTISVSACFCPLGQVVRRVSDCSYGALGTAC